MKKTLKSKKIFAAVLSLALTLSLLTTSVFAAWPVYGGNDNHNAVVSGAPTSFSTGYPKSLSLTPGTSGWDGVDNVPVMQTVGSTTYAYVLFDGRGSTGAQVVKVNCNTGVEVWRTTAAGTVGNTSLNAKSGFQLSTPYLDTKGTPNDESDDVLYVGVISQYDDYVGGEWLTGTGSKVLALTGLNTTTPNVSNVKTGITGQINTPIVKYGNYIYFGTWTSNTGAGTYYQVQLNSPFYSTKTFTTSGYGFYWAGAVVSGSYIYFGSDNAKLYYCQTGTNFGTSAGTLNLAAATGGISTAGNVRSTIMLGDDGKLYFTSQGGYLWACTIGSGGVPSIDWRATLGGTSTSTPTKVGNRIYVGYYSGFSSGGVQCVDAGGSHTVSTVATGFPVQCSILAQGNGTGTDYVYFNTNAATGAGYCYSYNGTTGTQAWKTANDTYALGGMAHDNGYLVFGNDYNNLYIVH